MSVAKFARWSSLPEAHVIMASRGRPPVDNCFDGRVF